MWPENRNPKSVILARAEIRCRVPASRTAAKVRVFPRVARLPSLRRVGWPVMHERAGRASGLDVRS
jgi:hypothetical protein